MGCSMAPDTTQGRIGRRYSCENGVPSLRCRARCQQRSFPALLAAACALLAAGCPTAFAAKSNGSWPRWSPGAGTAAMAAGRSAAAAAAGGSSGSSASALQAVVTKPGRSAAARRSLSASSVERDSDAAAWAALAALTAEPATLPGTGGSPAGEHRPGRSLLALGVTEKASVARS